MAKDKQQKYSVAEGKAASTTKMRRKEFEKELAKLQVELTRPMTRPCNASFGEKASDRWRCQC
jgi:hypothetical protein